MLFLYTVPCFASESEVLVDSSYLNFDNFVGYHMSEDSFPDGFYTFVNSHVNSSGSKIYIFPVLFYFSAASSYRYGYFVVSSFKYLNIEFSDTLLSSNYPTYFKVVISSEDNSSFSADCIFVRGISTPWGVDERQGYKKFTIPNPNYAMTNSVYDQSNYLFFDNGKCVSETFCSESAKGLEDYEEGNVKITGLTGFFKNILNKFTEQIESIKNIPSLILNGLKELFIPDTEKMKQSFSDFVDQFSNIFGFGPLIDTLKSVVNPETVSPSSPDVSEKFSYSLGNTSVDVDFSLPVSNFYTDDVKSKVSDYLKGIFYILLLFYNLSEIYFLIRGTRPWKDSNESSDDK